jgi:hypothetical protein
MATKHQIQLIQPSSSSVTGYENNSCNYVVKDASRRNGWNHLRKTFVWLVIAFLVVKMFVTNVATQTRYMNLLIATENSVLANTTLAVPILNPIPPMQPRLENDDSDDDSSTIMKGQRLTMEYLIRDVASRMSSATLGPNSTLADDFLREEEELLAELKEQQFFTDENDSDQESSNQTTDADSESKIIRRINLTTVSKGSSSSNEKIPGTNPAQVKVKAVVVRKKKQPKKKKVTDVAPQQRIIDLNIEKVSIFKKQSDVKIGDVYSGMWWTTVDIVKKVNTAKMTWLEAATFAVVMGRVSS